MRIASADRGTSFEAGPPQPRRRWRAGGEIQSAGYARRRRPTRDRGRGFDSHRLHLRPLRRGSFRSRELLRLSSFRGRTVSVMDEVARILDAENESRYDEADELLDRARANGDAFFRADRFRYALYRARLAARRGRRDEAAAFAHGALWQVAEDEAGPQLPQHPDVGRVDADQDTVDELWRYAESGDAEGYDAHIDDYRSVGDGQVQWHWSLVEGLRPNHRIVARHHHDAEAARRAAEPLLMELRAAGFPAYDLADFARAATSVEEGRGDPRQVAAANRRLAHPDADRDDADGPEGSLRRHAAAARPVPRAHRRRTTSRRTASPRHSERWRATSSSSRSRSSSATRGTGTTACTCSGPSAT